MTLKTKEELLAYALEKGYFGDGNILFACQDGNMWQDEESATAHKLAKNFDYYTIVKSEKKPKKEEPATETKPEEKTNKDKASK